MSELCHFAQLDIQLFIYSGYLLFVCKVLLHFHIPFQARRQVEKFKLLEERFYFYQKYRSLHVFQDFYVIKLSNIWKLSITSILVKLLKLFKESIRVLKLYALKKTG